MDSVNLKEATIVDVREPHEFEAGHVEGSINIPLGEVPEKITEFDSMKKPLVLICLSGNRSGQAVQFLANNGVENISNGGGWEEVKAQM